MSSQELQIGLDSSQKDDYCTAREEYIENISAWREAVAAHPEDFKTESFRIVSDTPNITEVK